MTRTLLMIAAAATLLAPPAALAQERPRVASTDPGQPVPPARPRTETEQVAPPFFPGTDRPAPSQNVKVDVTLTHSSANHRAVTRTVSLVLADRRASAIRMMHGRRMLNIDATPWVTPTGDIFLELKFSYAHPEAGAAAGAPVDTSTPSPSTATPVPVPDRITDLSTSQDLKVLLKPDVKTTIARTEDGAYQGSITVEAVARVQK